MSGKEGRSEYRRLSEPNPALQRTPRRRSVDYEFVVWDDGQVYFRVVGDEERVWAGSDAESFRRIASA